MSLVHEIRLEAHGVVAKAMAMLGGGRLRSACTLANGYLYGSCDAT